MFAASFICGLNLQKICVVNVMWSCYNYSCSQNRDNHKLHGVKQLSKTLIEICKVDYKSSNPFHRFLKERRYLRQKPAREETHLLSINFPFSGFVLLLTPVVRWILLSFNLTVVIKAHHSINLTINCKERAITSL